MNNIKIFRNLYDNFPISIFLLKSNKKVYECNRIAELYLNKSKKELVSRDFFEIFPISKEKMQLIAEMIYNIINFDLNEVLEVDFMNYKDQRAYVELFFSSVTIDDRKFIQVILQDVTERTLAENIIREENKKLRDLNEIKKKLTAKTSEELKSPLNLMSHASQVLLNLYKDKLDPNALQLLEFIKNGGEASINMVEKILDISKIEVDKFKLNKQTESLIEVIQESVNATMSKIKNKNVILNVDLLEDLYAEVDRLRIKQILEDLLLNLIKSAPKDSEISIYLQKNKNYAEIYIKTKNIKLNLKESQFEFQFSKEIVELHGGQIILDSESKKKHTYFSIQLPNKNWEEFLIHIYIIYKSGVPLFDYAFKKDKKNSDAFLISGGIVGLITILKAIIQGEKQIKTIDHGDRKIMFESNITNDIIFVLIVKENLIVFKRKLNAIIQEFDEKYKDLIKNIEYSASEFDEWQDLKFLIERYFGKGRKNKKSQNN